MKKTIVIIILAVYVASIAVVNFFGLETKMFDGITYVETIQCDSITLYAEGAEEIFPYSYTGKNADIPLFKFNFIPSTDGSYTADPESILKNPNYVQLNYHVFPNLVDDSGVTFEFDEDAGTAIYHTSSRSFFFLKPNKILTVKIKATDGSNVSTQIAIMAVLPS